MAIARDALAIAVADAVAAVSFGALAVGAGLSVWQACVLSLLAFTGASQFALVGVLSAGGGVAAGVAPALLLGVRNALYALRIRGHLRPLPAGAAEAHLVVDESSGMALVHERTGRARTAFFVTGFAVFVLWNAGTLLGAIAGTHISDPRRLGVDAAGPAVYLALVWAQIGGRRDIAVAALAAGITLVLIPFTPAGVPVLASAAAALAVALATAR